MSFPCTLPLLTEPGLPRLRSVGRPGFLLAALVAVFPACESSGGHPLPTPAGLADAAASPDIAARPDLAEPPPILTTYSNCPVALFADGTKPQDFSSASAFATAWKTSWVPPQISSGSLAFGPHPLTANWWENYSPAVTLDKPGDVLICARIRLTPQSTDPAWDNTFELTMRNPDGAMFETAGMVLLVESNASFVDLRTRTGTDSWTNYNRKPLAMQSGSETTFELLLFGQGSRFVAEVKNTATGQIEQLHGAVDLPAGGAVTLLGWRSRAGIFIDKLVLGQPSQAAAARLLPALTP